MILTISAIFGGVLFSLLFVFHQDDSKS